MLTTLDPKAALIVIDPQQGIVGSSSVHPTAGVIERAGRAPGRTEQPPRRLDTMPDGWTDLIPELDRRPGVATGTGVESTARQAYELGFNVTLAIDAMTDMRPEAHQYSITHVFPRRGETGLTRQIIDLLPARSAQE